MKRASDERVPVPCKTPRTQSKEKNTLNQYPVHVYCRLRPLQENAISCNVHLLSDTTLSFTTDSKPQYKEYRYVFKHIFSTNTEQKEVFEHVALPLLEDLINGNNGLLFTYGNTGSGKTFTLTGNQNNPGIMPQCIDTLFNTISDYQAGKFLIKSDKMNGFEVQSETEALEERFSEKKSLKNLRSLKKNRGDSSSCLYINNGTKISNFTESNKFAVFITYIEIYNNIVYDLLDESTGKVLQSKIIRKDFQNNMYVNGIIEVEVKSAVEAFELFHVGQKRKRMAHTALNAESSRSHSIFNIRLVQLKQIAENDQGQRMIPDQNFLKVSQLSLVDLAGSERCNRTQNTGMRLKEAGSINNSLMCLRTCLEILRENQLNGSNKLVPYRDSRLTLLFKNYFEGKGQVRMIVCINPSIQDYEENLQVLKFAETTQEVKVPVSEVKYTVYTPPNIQSIKHPRSVQTPSTLKAKKVCSASFAPKIPNFKLNYEDAKENVVNFDNLLRVLRSSKQKRETSDKKQTEKEDHFRKRLVELNKVMVVGKSDTRNVRTSFKKQKDINKNLEFKITDLETCNNNLVCENTNLQEKIQTLENTIENRNLEINQNLLACEVRKGKLAFQNAKLMKEHEEVLQKQRQYHDAEMQFKDFKLKKVKEVVDEVFTSTPVKLNHDYIPQQTPPTYRRNIKKSVYHRRSRSAGCEAWLEHNTIKPVPLGTLFQPAMKKRRSVTKLDKASEVTNSKQNKYCLIAQEAQDDGAIETKLYKGDIIATCGGGAQVVFNEVEKLKQVSPNAND